MVLLILSNGFTCLWKYWKSSTCLITKTDPFKIYFAKIYFGLFVQMFCFRMWIHQFIYPYNSKTLQMIITIILSTKLCGQKTYRRHVDDDESQIKIEIQSERAWSIDNGIWHCNVNIVDWLIVAVLKAVARLSFSLSEYMNVYASLGYILSVYVIVYGVSLWFSMRS